MAIVKKTNSISGAWVKGAEVKDGSKVKLVSEADFIPSKFDDTKTQLTAKCRFEGDDGEAKNININKPSQNALVEAFGEDSKGWIGKTLTAHTEKVVVSGKRVTAVYLVPEGFEVAEDENGYVVIREKGAGPKISGTDIEYPTDEINPEDIPFD